MHPRRSAEGILVAALWAASVVGCGCGGAPSTGDGGSDAAAPDARVDAAAPDARVDAVVEAGVDASTLDCEGEFLFYHYVFDGVADVTGCVSASSATHVHRDGAGDRTRTRIGALPLPAPFLGSWPMPELVCRTGIMFDNMSLVTDASGELDLDYERAWPIPWSAHAIVPMAYNPEPEEGVLCGESAAIWATRTGGTWHVLQGGSATGDWVEVEARDVTYAPMAGHTLRFDRMRWRVQLREPGITDLTPSVDGGSDVGDAGFDAGSSD